MTDNESSDAASSSDPAVTEGAGGAVGTRGVRRRKRKVGFSRSNRVVIKHDDEEYARVLSMAAALGVSPPNLYERALFAGSVQAAVGVEEIALGMLGVRRLLANAANNLNQIARAANSGDGVNAVQLSETLRLFDRTIDQLRMEIDNLHRFVPGVEDAL